jgi:hypothetical protein
MGWNREYLGKPCYNCGTPWIKGSSAKGLCKKCYDKLIQKRVRRADPEKRAKDRKYMREYGMIRKRGIEPDEFRARLEYQNYSCTICARELAEDFGTVVDHDHKTGKLRDLLCRNCNSMLGLAQESETILWRAIQYLGKYSD